MEVVADNAPLLPLLAGHAGPKVAPKEIEALSPLPEVDHSGLVRVEGETEVAQDGGRPPLGREGQGTGRWTLLDFGAFVIHVFYHPVREFYDLESLWIEAPRVKLDVPPEATLAQPDALYAL